MDLCVGVTPHQSPARTEQRFKMETVKQKTKELEDKTNIIAQKAHQNASIIEQAKTE